MRPQRSAEVDLSHYSYPTDTPGANMAGFAFSLSSSQTVACPPSLLFNLLMICVDPARADAGLDGGTRGESRQSHGSLATP
jgi:hypothetical protein